MSDDHITPDFLAMLFEGWFDPCPYPRPVWDGLSIPWMDKTYANIPYSRRTKDKPGPEAWVKKAIRENAKGKRIALLVRHDHSTAWWAEARNAGGHFLPIMERVQFLKSDGSPNGDSPNFLSTLILFGVKPTGAKP